MRKLVVTITVITTLLLGAGLVYSQTDQARVQDPYIHTLLLDSVLVDAAGLLLTYERSDFTIGEIYIAARMFSTFERPETFTYPSRMYRNAGSGPPYLLLYYEGEELAFVDVVLPAHPQALDVAELADPDRIEKLQGVQTIQFE